MPVPAAATETQSPAPQGALCATHPEARASIICERCGRFACPDCTSEEGRTCRECRAKAPPALARASWGWVFGWVFATLAGMALAVFAAKLNQGLPRAAFSHFQFELQSWLLVLCGCLGVPSAQALALARLKKRVWEWTAVTALPTFACIVVPNIAGSSPGPNGGWIGAVSLFLLIVAPPLAQCLLLRRWVKRAWLWAPVCLLALVVGFFAAFFLRQTAFSVSDAVIQATPGKFLPILGALIAPCAFAQAVLLKALPRKKR